MMNRISASVRLAAALLPAVLFVACAPPAGTAAPEVGGTWRAWLDSPGGELPFGLEIAGESGALTAVLINGPERIDVPSVAFRDGELTISIEHYDSVIRATLDDAGQRLNGGWSKTAGPDGKRSALAFHATRGAAPRFAAAGEPQDVAGRWAVNFESDELPAVAILDAGSDGAVWGTFLTATGDYRYLAGHADDGRLRLSAFDGAHAFLFDARLQPDGTLAGDFWSRDTWHESWTARRDEQAWSGSRSVRSSLHSAC